MAEENLRQEIGKLEKILKELKATIPAHESSGAHAMKMLMLEDELAEKRKALGSDGPGEDTIPARRRGKGLMKDVQ